MSSPHHTLSPHELCLAKTKAPREHTEEEWQLISEEEEHKVQEAAVRAKEEAKRMAREVAERKEREAAEEWAYAEWRALEERLWELVAQCSEMAAAPPWVSKHSRRMSMDPCTRCYNKGTLCVLGTAKGKTMVCKVCCHVKASCSWTKKMTGEAWKRKWVQHLEEVEDMEMVEVSEDDKEEEVQSHFMVLIHLAEVH
ncbi:hypothetical protein ID866_8129 [Astraeus odoratus]|nr:hypothetical protein ID866_8129 [Astraeus odoratus]